MKFLGIGIIVGAGFLLSAHDVISTKITWTREISRVMYKRCASCHHDGGSSFSLMTYEESRPWAKAIKEEVLERRMPPFGAVKGFSDLRDDQALTQEELHLIADWVEGGAPEGDRSLLPKMPDFKVAAARQSGAKPAPELVVDGAATLKRPMTFAGIRPRTLQEGGSLKAIAERPDGSFEPLLWIYDYASKFNRTYYFRAPMSFPAGTKIRVYPVDAGAVSLITGS